MTSTLKTIALAASAGALAACNGGLGASAPEPAPAASAQAEPAPTPAPASAPARRAAIVAEAGFTSSGEVEQPGNWREWVFVGSPITPNGLNGGEAPFPEFHNVYVEPSAFDHYQRTGQWAEGTQVAKELVRVYQNSAGNFENGSSAEVSGVGYQQGEFAGLELSVKDSARFPDAPGGWAYFSFGHKPEPYAKTAEAFPNEACNACHAASAETDFVFTQFYPVIRGAR